MAKKRFLLILGVVILALVMVKATLAAASSALQTGLPGRAVTIAAQNAQIGNEVQGLESQPIARRYASAPPLSNKDVGQTARPLASSGPSRKPSRCAAR